jgi:hypothetical protein
MLSRMSTIDRGEIVGATTDRVIEPGRCETSLGRVFIRP